MSEADQNEESTLKKTIPTFKVNNESSETIKDDINVSNSAQNNSQNVSMTTTTNKNSNDVLGAISKLENELKDLKNQIIRSRELPKKRCRSTSTDRYKSNFRSPSPKRTRNDSPYKYGHSSKYEPTSSQSKDYERYSDHSVSRSSSSERSFSRYVSDKLEKELSTFLRDNYMSTDSSSSRYSRKYRKDLSLDRSCSSEDRSSYAKKDYEYKKHRRSKEKSHSRRSDKYNKHFKYMNANDIQVRYARFQSVMYAFSIIMAILQEDMYNTN